MSELYVYTTPLHDAVRENNTEKVRVLLKNGANIFEKDDDDITSFELAQILNNSDVVALLEEVTTRSRNQMIAK
jgi:ankyrin repeat protein